MYGFVDVELCAFEFPVPSVAKGEAETPV